MPFPQAEAHVISDFGGLQSVTAAGDCPPGTSADCENVMFYPGAVRHRDGFGTYYTDDEGGIIYWEEFITPDGTSYKLLFFDTGAIKLQTGEGASAFLAPGRTSTDGTFVTATKPMATTFMGRAFMALGDGSKGTELMRQYSPTLNALLPVAPDGPGVATTMHAGYPTYTTAVPDGQITDGVSAVNFVVIFVTKTGFATAPGPPCTVTPTASPAGFGTMYKLDNIAIGPSYVTERWIFMTPSTGGGLNDYYHMGGGPMQIKDNSTTTSGEFGYTDAILTGSGKRLIEVMAPPLAEHAGVTSYNQRLVVWGGRSALQNVLSSKTSFAAGDASGKGYMQGPIGWRLEGGNDGTSPNGWTITTPGSALTTSATAVGDVVRWTGTGVGADSGDLVSGTTVVTGVDGVDSPFLAGITYRYRIRLRRSAGATGTFQVTTSGGTWDIDIATEIGEDWTIIEGGDGAVMAPTLKVKAADPLPLAEWVDFDRLHAFEKGFPYERSIVRVSRIQDPESFVEVSEAGLLSVSPDDGEEVRACIAYRGNLYIFKERSMWCAIDNGGEPGNWSVNLVSSQVGVDSSRGVVAGDGFLIIINRNGLYLFQGGQPTKISTEIDGTWRASAFGGSAFGIVDSERQQLLAFPVTGSANDKATYCDFFEGLSQAGTYTQGHGRKYANWTVPTIAGVTYGSLMVRSSGVRDVLIGKKTTTSNDCVNSENGVLSASGAFPMAGWVNEVGSVPTAVTSALPDPLGTSNAWEWVEDNTTHTRIVSGKTSSASHAFCGVWLRSMGAPFSALIGIRTYNGTTDSDPFTDVTKAITITSEWKRFTYTSVDISHNVTPTLPSGRRCMVLVYTGPVTLQMYGHQVISGSPWDTGYARTVGATVTGVSSSIIQALTRTRPALYVDPITSATTFTNYPESPYDSDGTIISFYVGAPVGRTRERGAFLGCSMKVWGVGTLVGKIYKLYPRGELTVATRTMTIDASEDVELLYGPAVAQPGLAFNSWQLNWRIGTQDALDWWNISSLNIYEKQSTAPQRGT
jgi:hypothetical protein